MPETKTSDEKLLYALRDILPSNLRLYDFSKDAIRDEIPTFSTEPLPAGRLFLTTSLCILEDIERGKYLSVEVERNPGADPNGILLESTNIVEQLVKAVPLFEERSVPSLEDATKKEHRVR